MVVSALGVPLDLRVEDGALDATLRSLTVDLATPNAVAAATVEVLGTGPWMVRSPAWFADHDTAEQALSGALTAVNLTGVARTPHLALHCAVVARGTDAVVLAASSGTGKTTLTAELLQHGWDYVSDEALVLPWDGDPLVPYPRPLALSPWSAAQLGISGPFGLDEVFAAARDIGARAADACPVGIRHVVRLTRDGRAPGLRRISRAEALQALWRRGFSHHRDPAQALRLISEVVAGAKCWRFDVGRPGTNAARLQSLG